LIRLGGLGDIEGIAGKEFYKGIFVPVNIALNEGCQALLELREGGFGGTDGPAAGQAAQGQSQACGSSDGEDQDESEAGGGYASMRKGERIGDGDQDQCGQQSAAGENGKAAQQSAPTQTLFQLRNVSVKLLAETHGTSNYTVSNGMAGVDN